jgi:hypothetical protein
MEIFGVKSKGTPKRWREKGATVAYISKNKWDLRKLIAWWAENIFYPKDNKEIADSRERWEKARAEKMEFEVAKMKGEFMEKEGVQQELIEYLSTAIGAFYLLPKNAPVFLEGKVTDMPGAIESLETAVAEICDGMAERATLEKIENKLSKI